MHPLYRLDSHYLLIIHRWVYRNFVENYILNVPVGTELHVNGRKDHYLTNRFVRTEEGFLYDPWCMRTSAIAPHLDGSYGMDGGKTTASGLEIGGIYPMEVLRNPQPEGKKVYKSFHEFWGQVNKVQE
ncbi:hypothetical protein TNCT_570131 [Trichonephila clavata]|uniref:Uncharacterized protein n=1 Tax=Trichonephila clavata TaxID=2740835 RepID=A0A8X6INA5_TRICU|nr:hypothetical protein TNCT_570131 [Trichonephila clavata]